MSSSKHFTDQAISPAQHSFGSYVLTDGFYTHWPDVSLPASSWAELWTQEWYDPGAQALTPCSNKQELRGSSSLASLSLCPTPVSAQEASGVGLCKESKRHLAPGWSKWQSNVRLEFFRPPGQIYRKLWDLNPKEKLILKAPLWFINHKTKQKP